VQQRSAPSGLKVRAASDSLSRLAGQELGGLTEVAGVLTGTLQDLRFNGQGAVQNLQAPGYRLASVAGPLRLTRRKGEIAVGGELQGRGGAGQGLLAGWLGASPRAAVELARLADGRMLVRSLDATGAGLRLRGSGSRGLLGDLAFRGEATLTNVASVRTGARGALTAEFDARRGGGDRPWSFSLDARGERLATGLAQLDRILGQRPRLQLAADYRDSRLQVERAVLEGAAGRVSGWGGGGCARAPPAAAAPTAGSPSGGRSTSTSPGAPTVRSRPAR
jgi:translocation and assembly module TamB